MMMLRAIVLTALLALSGCAQKVVRLDSVLPAQIGQFSEVGLHIYPEAHEGYSVRFATERNHMADVYVYPLPQWLVGESEQTILESIALDTIGGMKAAQEAGLASDLKLEESAHLQMNGHRVLKFDASFERQDLPWYSVAYLAVRDKTLLKVRISMPDSPSNRGSTEWDDFAAEVVEVFDANPRVR